MASDTSNEDALAAANATFESFWSMLKWSAGFVALIVILVIYAVTHWL